jgi:hypothetical protein
MFHPKERSTFFYGFTSTSHTQVLSEAAIVFCIFSLKNRDSFPLRIQRTRLALRAEKPEDLCTILNARKPAIFMSLLGERVAAVGVRSEQDRREGAKAPVGLKNLTTIQHPQKKL